MISHEKTLLNAFSIYYRNAIFEVEKITQAPFPLIISSLLGSISLVCQNSIDVCRLNKIIGPVSLYILMSADSGERKSTVDSLFIKPIQNREYELFDEYEKDLINYDLEQEIVETERKVLISELKLKTRRGEDVALVKEKLKALRSSYPTKPDNMKLIATDVTPAALKDRLCGLRRSIGIMSDEAGIIFNGYAFNEIFFINKLWDGSTISVERKNAPLQLIRDARVTVSLMMQPSVLNNCIQRKGDLFKGSGFFSRCYICQPESTQGWRQITNPVFSMEYLPQMHKRMLEIVNENINSSKERTVLHFSREAEGLWIDHYNDIETKMGQLMSDVFTDFKDYASKIAENTARVAALLYYFEHGIGNISKEAMESAIQISTWYAKEHVKLFTKANGSGQHQIISDEDELYQWMKDYCVAKLMPAITKNTILQYGPNRFRKRHITNELISQLVLQKKIQTFSKGRTMLIKPLGTGLI